MNQTIAIVSLNNLGCLSGYLHTNVDNAQKYLNKKLISILVNHKDLAISIDSTSKTPILTYQNKDYMKLLND